MVADVVNGLPTPPEHTFVCGSNPFVDVAALTLTPPRSPRGVLPARTRMRRTTSLVSARIVLDRKLPMANGVRRRNGVLSMQHLHRTGK
jgi:hypothetical protein